MKKIFFALFLLSVLFSKPHSTDSLRAVLKKATHDSTRVKTLNAWAQQVISSNADTSLLLSTEAKKIAEKNLNNVTDHFLTHFFRRNLSESLMKIGVIYFNKAKMELCISSFEYALKIREQMLMEAVGEAEQRESRLHIAHTFNNMGEFYRRKGMMTEALKYCTKSIGIKETTLKEKLSADETRKVKIALAYSYNNLSILYRNDGKIDEAYKILLLAVKLNTESGEKKMVASNYLNIANICAVKGQNDKAMIFYKKVLKIYEDAGDQVSVASACNAIGDLLHNTGKTGEAINWFTKAFSISKETNNVKSMASAYSNLARVYDESGNGKVAFECYQKSLELNKQAQDKQAIAYGYGNIARFYQNEARFKDALENYDRCLELLEAMNDQEGIAHTLNNVGNIYLEQDMKAEAENNYEKALAIYTKTKNKNGMAFVMDNLGNIYASQGKTSEGIEMNRKSFLLQQEMGDKSGMATSFNNLGAIYNTLGQSDSAKINLKRSLALFREVKALYESVDPLVGLSSILFKENDFAGALKYGLEGLKNAKLVAAPKQIRNAAKILKDIYTEQKQPALALQMFELYVQMRDSISNEENKKAGVRNQLKYEYDKKSAADSVKNIELQKVKDAKLAAQNSQIKQEKFKRYSLIVGLLFVVCGLLFVVNRFRITSRQKKIIEEQKIKVDEAFDKLHEKNKEVLDSIHYAKRIQRALITSEKYIEKNLRALKKQS